MNECGILNIWVEGVLVGCYVFVFWMYMRASLRLGDAAQREVGLRADLRVADAEAATLQMINRQLRERLAGGREI